MFYFKDNNRMNKGFLIFILVSVLASCTSFQTKNNSKKEAAEGSKLVDKAGLEHKDSENNKAASKDIVDPMANIQINGEIKKAYKQTAVFISSKQYAKALQLMISIKGKYPQLSGPNYQMARIYLVQKKLDKALEQVDASLTKNARNYYSMSLKGVILKTQGKFKDAKTIYLKAIELYPLYSKSHLNLGVLADVYLGELELALVEYKKYMQLTSNEDKKIANWVLEVERRIKTQK